MIYNIHKVYKAYKTLKFVINVGKFVYTTGVPMYAMTKAVYMSASKKNR